MTKIATVLDTLARSQDHDGYYQSFGYDAFGSLVSVTDSLSNTLFSASYAYGINAFQTGITDIDRGSLGFAVNALGEVIATTDANGSTFSMTYDRLSRLVTRYVPGEGTITFTWGTDAAKFNIGRLYSSTSTNGTTETYTYDGAGRETNRKIDADGTSYNYDMTFGPSGQIGTLTYPTSTSGYRLSLQYTYQNGFMTQVKDANAGTVFWSANAANVRGQITQETLGNGLVKNRAYDEVTGWLSYIQCGIGGGACSQNQSYLYDLVGNVTQRQNNNLGLTENFYYDNLYRLSYSQLNGVTSLSMGYDAMGNITSKSDVAAGATWTYHATKKHAVTQAGSGAFTYSYDANGNAVTRNGYGITWSKDNYPTVISGNGESTTLYYNANKERWKQTYVKGSTNETILYIGGLMQKVSIGGVDDYRYQISANGQTIAIMSRTTVGANATRYLLSDHQGSIAKITNSSGANIVSESFTAFGARRNPATWSGIPTNGDQNAMSAVTREGYTGHEALGALGLTHMNGRVQDAITGRFLSADPFISEPGNTQNYNRYSYVYNNPLTLTDPSGFCTGGVWGQYMECVQVEASRIWPYLGGINIPITPPPPFTPPVPFIAGTTPTGEQGQTTVTTTAKRVEPQTKNQPHHYEVDIPLGLCLSQSEGFDVMRNFSAPGLFHAQDGTHEVELAGGNWIQQTVDPTAMTITNVAIPGRHVFGGYVQMSMYQRNGVTGVHVEGGGSGPNGKENQFWGPKIFEALGAAAFTSIPCNGVGAAL